MPGVPSNTQSSEKKDENGEGCISRSYFGSGFRTRLCSLTTIPKKQGQSKSNLQQLASHASSGATKKPLRSNPRTLEACQAVQSKTPEDAYQGRKGLLTSPYGMAE